MNVPKDKVKWESKKIIRHENGRGCDDYYEYEIMIPDFLAAWDVWDYWEKERFDSMRAFLRKGDILFDVGTEVGWTNIIYAGYVGGENMVLIEPTPNFWPNIKEILKLPENVEKPIYFVGHSFGGALATLAAAHIQPRKLANCFLVTFGSPRVGNKAFTKLFKEVTVYRFVNGNDVVTRLPHFKVHVGNRRHLIYGAVTYDDEPLGAPFKLPIVFPSRITDHFVSAYHRAMCNAYGENGAVDKILTPYSLDDSVHGYFDI